jgi:hypothetical protein
MGLAFNAAGDTVYMFDAGAVYVLDRLTGVVNATLDLEAPGFGHKVLLTPY